jgi:hypothetical protein
VVLGVAGPAPGESTVGATGAARRDAPDEPDDLRLVDGHRRRLDVLLRRDAAPELRLAPGAPPARGAEHGRAGIRRLGAKNVVEQHAGAASRIVMKLHYESMKLRILFVEPRLKPG